MKNSRIENRNRAWQYKIKPRYEKNKNLVEKLAIKLDIVEQRISKMKDKNFINYFICSFESKWNEIQNMKER